MFSIFNHVNYSNSIINIYYTKSEYTIYNAETRFCSNLGLQIGTILLHLNSSLGVYTAITVRRPYLIQTIKDNR